MNLICDKLPDSVLVDGESYFINTDFKVWLKIQSLLNQRTETCFVKALCLCFKKMPQNIEKATSAMLDFLVRGEKPKKKKKTGARLYDLDADSGLLLSSFLSFYHIDLRNTNMHWYVFLELVSSLPEDSPFSKAVYYRGVDLSQIKDKEQKKYYKKMKSLYHLAQVVDDFMVADALGGAFNND